jgi:hypothetical protein
MSSHPSRLASQPQESEKRTSDTTSTKSTSTMSSLKQLLPKRKEKEGEPTYWGTKAGRKRSTGGISLVTMMLVRGMPLEEEARLLEARDTKVEF